MRTLSILLLPTLEEVKERDRSRDYNLEEDGVEILHQEQNELKEFDEKIDNTGILKRQQVK